MSPALKKSILTHTLIIVGFFIITVLVHFPTFSDGKSIDQHDILQATGGNNQLAQYRKGTGDEALWNNYMFSGMPAYLTGIQYSGDILKHVYKTLFLGMSYPSFILFISFINFYILLLSFKVKPLVACAGAIAFGLNGFNIIGIMAGHNAKIAAVAFMPLVLAGIHLAFNKRRWLGFGLTALSLGLQIRTNHPQVTYYLLLIVLIYGVHTLLKAVREKSYKEFSITSMVLILSAILAVGANYGRLSTTLEYSSFTIRGESELSEDKKASSGLDKEYAFRYSNGIMEPLFLFVPNVFGGASQQKLSSKSEVAKVLKQSGHNRIQIEQQLKAVPTYWGDQPLTAPYYAGTATVLLFILGIILLPKKENVWLIALVVVGIILSWGKSFPAINDLLFDYLPGYNKFRSVTFTIIISIFAMNLLGFIALDRLLGIKWDDEGKKKFFIAAGVSGGFLLVLVIISGAFSYSGAIDSQLPDWFVEAMREDRQSLLIRDSLRALLFVILPASAMWLLKKEKLKPQIALIGVIVFIFLDSFSLSKRFLGSEKFKNDPAGDFFKMTDADKTISATRLPGERVLNLQNPFNESRTSYYHESIGGYHGAKIRRYQDIIDYYINTEMQEAIQSLQNQSGNFSDLQVLNMLNTKFFYAGVQSNGVFPNTYANGNAWTVTEVVPVNSPNEEIVKLREIDTKAQAIIDISTFDLPEAHGTGVVTLLERTPNNVSYSASISGGNALGVFSEMYYPKGWSAKIDGVDAEIIRTNYVLRALEIPDGSHTIEFVFAPTAYSTGNKVMMISSWLTMLVFASGIVLDLKKK